jgi:VanZ family protein
LQGFAVAANPFLLPTVNSIFAIFLNTKVWRTTLFALCLIVTYLALTPHPPTEADLFGWDKLNHAAAFAALAWAAVLGFRERRNYGRYVALGLVAYGAAKEVAQAFVPGRSSEWADLLADSLGIAVGMLLATALLRWWLHARQ